MPTSHLTEDGNLAGCSCQREKNGNKAEILSKDKNKTNPKANQIQGLRLNVPLRQEERKMCEEDVRSVQYMYESPVASDTGTFTTLHCHSI